MTFWDFWHEHWFLAIVSILCVYYLLTKLIYRIPNMIKVIVRGWPPNHLDDGGDWKPIPPPPEE